MISQLQHVIYIRIRVKIWFTLTAYIARRVGLEGLYTAPQYFAIYEGAYSY